MLALYSSGWPWGLFGAGSPNLIRFVGCVQNILPYLAGSETNFFFFESFPNAGLRGPISCISFFLQKKKSKAYFADGAKSRIGLQNGVINWCPKEEKGTGTDYCKAPRSVAPVINSGRVFTLALHKLFECFELLAKVRSKIDNSNNQTWSS